jgi:hypothetical protein
MWNGGSAMIGWLAGHYAALGGIKPHWAILMGTTVFFLLAAIYYFLFRRPQVNETGREAGREAGRQAYEKADEQVVLLQKQLKAARDHAKRIAEFPCPDKWLHEIAKSDAEQLQIMVRVVKIVCKNEMRTKVLSYYYFHFVIENWTVYPLEIDRDISGSISFLGHNFKHKPEITQGSKLLCGPRSETIFTIQQQLEYPQEVEHIEKGPDTEDFMFTGLKIRVTGLGQFASLIQGVELNTKYGVSKKPGWAEGDSLKNYA